MKAKNFDFILKDLEMFFVELTSWQREQYFKHLGLYPRHILDQAKEWLIGNHPYKRTPTIAEFKSAVEEVYRKSQEALITDLEPIEICAVCFGSGHHIIKAIEDGAYDKARPCNCKQGDKVKKVWENIIKNKGVITIMSKGEK